MVSKSCAATTVMAKYRILILLVITFNTQLSSAPSPSAAFLAFRLRANNSPTNDDTVDRRPQNPLVTASIQIVSDSGSSGSWNATSNGISRMLPNRLAINVPIGMLHRPLNSLPRYQRLNAPKGANSAASHNLLSTRKHNGMVSAFIPKKTATQIPIT